MILANVSTTYVDGDHSVAQAPKRLRLQVDLIPISAPQYVEPDGAWSQAIAPAPASAHPEEGLGHSTRSRVSMMRLVTHSTRRGLRAQSFAPLMVLLAALAGSSGCGGGHGGDDDGSWHPPSATSPRRHHGRNVTAYEFVISEPEFQKWREAQMLPRGIAVTKETIILTCDSFAQGDRNACVLVQSSGEISVEETSAFVRQIFYNPQTGFFAYCRVDKRSD